MIIGARAPRPVRPGLAARQIPAHRDAASGASRAGLSKPHACVAHRIRRIQAGLGNQSRPGPVIKNLVAIEAQHEEPNGGRQVAVLAIAIDAINETRQRRLTCFSNLFQSAPELILKADACLVFANDNRALNDSRFREFHCMPK